MATTIDKFLKQKLNNFILYLGETIGENNGLYKQVLQFRDNESALIEYSSYIVKAAQVNSKGKYYFDEKTIVEYLSANGIKEYDDKFVPKVSRYMEMFANVLGGK